MDVRFLTAGERCVTVCFGDEVSLELNSKVRMLNEALREDPIVGIVETVPTYCALSVHYDPMIIRRKALEEEIKKRIAHMKPLEEKEESLKEVPVYYGGETGPDLESCAKMEGISQEELIDKHSRHKYYVYQLGFAPGHPYMARFDEPFSFKRRQTPRVDIPPRSVVVQQNLTNISPFHQPCGWHVIGSVPFDIADITKADPFYFKAGDWVKFVPIDKKEYDRLLDKNKPHDISASDDHHVKNDDVNSSDVPELGINGFEVIKPGALTTIQDEGRYGYQNSGVTPAGPMDHRAFHLANILVGNRKGAPALEITVTGPTIRFDKATVIAVTGADITPMINGAAITMYKSIIVNAGDELSFGQRKNGCRAYVAFAGGIVEKKVMGSCATCVKNAMGGHHGRALKTGDHIALAQTLGNEDILQKQLPKETYNDKEIEVRVVTGPQEDRFTKAGKRQFFNYSAVVTEKSDRQGIRLDGRPLEFVTDGNIISDGISMGAIQVPSDGKPIILLADRQSVGGYTKMGNVIYVDLPKLAQAMPGCKVRFVEVSLELAEELYIKEMKSINELEDRYVQS